MLSNSNLFEGIEHGDLRRLVKPVVTIDEFRSKMGEDKDIIVLSFTVLGKEPAEDLVNFAEKSYDWVLDADLSSGETSDGNYIVFVEVERSPKIKDQLISFMNDLLNLTEQSASDWTFTYYKDPTHYPITEEELTKHIIDSPQEYENKLGDNLNELRIASGIPIKASIIKDVQILDLQMAAGIR